MGSDRAELDVLVERLKASRLPAPATRRRIREGAGVSLRQAAGAIGVATMTLHRWERGTAHPRSLERAIQYRRLLDELEELG